MIFDEIRFPDDVSFGAKGGPEFNTNVVIFNSGFEQRESKWSSSRLRFDVSTGLKTKAQLDELISFFRARKGRAIGFRFKDWVDYKVKSQVIGNGDGITREFQLVKSYTYGDFVCTRIINKPVINTVKIYLDSVEQSSGFEVDFESGRICFDFAPLENIVITADFEFDVPVRFDNDFLNISMENLKSGKIDKIEIIELKI